MRFKREKYYHSLGIDLWKDNSRPKIDMIRPRLTQIGNEMICSVLWIDWQGHSGLFIHQNIMVDYLSTKKLNNIYWVAQLARKNLRKSVFSPQSTQQ